MPAQSTNADIDLTNALREAARRFQGRKPIDAAALSRLIEARRGEQPLRCAILNDLIQAAQDDTSRGDRESALKHFRAAIEFAEGAPKAT
jgi:hypothetical protein